MTSNFHKNSNINRFFMPRKLGGRGIKEIMIAYEYRIVSAKQHLTQHKKNNKYLNKVIESEENVIIRIATQPVFTCSKLTKETLQQGVKYVQS